MPSTGTLELDEQTQAHASTTVVSFSTDTQSATSPFRFPSFRRFYAGQTLSYFGDGFRSLAIPLIVFHLTGTATSIGISLGLQSLPYGFMSIIGGSLGDRVDRRTVMLACDAIRFGVMTLLAIVYAVGHLNVGMAYAGVFAMSLAGAVFTGCEMPSIPFLVGDANAKGAVATLQTTEQAVNLVAPPLGGTVLAIVGPLPALILDALSYLGSLASIACVKTFGPEKKAKLPSLGEIWSDLRMGWQFIAADRCMLILTVSSFVLSGAYMMVMVNVVPLFKREYHAGDQAIGFAFGCMAIGAVVGALLAGNLHRPFGKIILQWNYVDAVPWLVVAFTHNFYVAVICIGVSNMANSYKFVNGIAWRIRVIPSDLTGRVFGAARFISVPGVFCGGLAGGILSDHVGTHTAILVGIGIYIAWATAICFSKKFRAEMR